MVMLSRVLANWTPLRRPASGPRRRLGYLIGDDEEVSRQRRVNEHRAGIRAGGGDDVLALKPFDTRDAGPVIVRGSVLGCSRPAKRPQVASASSRSPSYIFHIR
jgi:hypothetical protein